MTACIVGWAHTPFGRLDGETVESLIVRVATGALAEPAWTRRGRRRDRARPLQRGFLGAGFHRLAGAAGFAGSALQARDAGGERLRHRFRRRASGPEGDRGEGGAHRARGRCRADDDDARPEIGKNLLKASYLREEADIEGGFAGVFGKIAGLYFQRYGDQSDALAMIAAKNHKNGVGNPYAQMRKDLGFEFCRNASEKNPFVAGPLKRTDCSLVSDGAAALRAGRRRDRAAAAQGDRVPRRPRTCRTSCR